jgi:SAM-dependent methyltransferase
MGTDGEYLLANRRAQVGERLAALAALFDPSTFRHLDDLGLGPGRRCWEVGAGGPSVPLGLAARVGPTGLVVATDIDVSGLAGLDGVWVVRHDVGTDDPPATGLDLVHARLVLTHVPQRDAALASMAAALRPGGRLLVEDADPGLQPLICLDDHGPAQHLANRLRRGFRTLMLDRGADLAFGRTLPRRLREVGLVDVGADAYFPITAPACAVLERTTVEQVRDLLVGSGLATAAEVDEHLDNVARGRLPDLATPPMISAWARRP